jgi:hypothetical protein
VLLVSWCITTREHNNMDMMKYNIQNWNHHTISEYKETVKEMYSVNQYIYLIYSPYSKRDICRMNTLRSQQPLLTTLIVTSPFESLASQQ